MLKVKILSFLILPILILSLMSGIALAADACDADNDGTVTTQEAIKCGADSGSGNSNKTPGSLNTTIARVINILSSLVAVVAVIMIIVGGFRYVTSGGDTTKTGTARSTITNALIGLVIAVFAQVIVRFVLHAVK